MARVTYVKSAKGRKDGRARTCAGCGTEIKPGDSYKWFANRIGRYSSRKNYCANCRIRPSMMTTSANLSALYAAQEAAEDALARNPESLTDIAEIVREYAQGVRDVGEMYVESADAMEDGFGHETYQSQEIREKADACESAADEAESAADEIENMDDPEADESDFLGEYEGEYEDDAEGNTIFADPDDWAEFVEGKRDELRQNAIDKADETVNEGVPF